MIEGERYHGCISKIDHERGYGCVELISPDNYTTPDEVFFHIKFIGWKVNFFNLRAGQFIKFTLKYDERDNRRKRFIAVDLDDK